MNLARMLAETAARLPDKPALSFHHRDLTYRQLDELASKAAAAFAEAGVRPGDRVALYLGNVPEFVLALYGAWRAGAVAVPLNPMLTPEELGYMLADAGSRAVVVEMGELPKVLAVRDRLSDLETVLVVAGPPVPTGTVSFDERLEHAGPAPEVPLDDDALALLQYTTGTTARPRGAMLSHANLWANLEQIDAVPALRGAEQDVNLLVLPVFHIYALNTVLNLTLRTGATAVLVERFDPSETLELVEGHRVSILFGAPPMFRAWLATAGTNKEAFGSVRMGVSGAAPLPADVLERFRDRFDVTIWEGYGLTEAGPAVTTNALGNVAKGGSIGLPLPGLEVRLVDEDGGDAEDGDPGEIVVRGPNVFSGYWAKEEETAEVLRDGWLATGDVAYADEDGYLFLVDRKRDLVIVSGFNVYPKEVEETLARHPAVAEAAVTGVPDERTGEAVKATVVLRQGANASPEDIIDHASRYLARFKVPKEVEIARELPKHSTGKVLRRLLRGEELLGEAREDSPH